MKSVFSGPYFPVFNPNAEKYGPEKTLYLGTFHAVVFGTALKIWHKNTCEIAAFFETLLAAIIVKGFPTF